MGLAELVDAPVLLAGDIDRGGVFAQLYGTIALLEEKERARVKGTIINKFRGDRAILEPGIRMIEQICGVPVAGVIPYMHLDIDDEDSLTERFTRETREKAVDIAVIRLPRISNFTDFSPFEYYPDVSLRYISRLSDLGNPDLILIPGTKSTISDLLWLRQSGLEAAVLKAAAEGTPVFGICGGYQMLGKKISDPGLTETAGIRECRGMGLLDHETVFRSEKTQTRTEGVFQNISGVFSGLNGLKYSGYEIHMGQNIGESSAVVSKGNVYGTYIHGIFDGEGISGEIVRSAACAKGITLAPDAPPDIKNRKEQQYDLLADAVRKNLDMELIRNLIAGNKTVQNRFLSIPT